MEMGLKQDLEEVVTEFIENIEIDSVNKEQNNHSILGNSFETYSLILLKIYDEEFDPGSG